MRRIEMIVVLAAGLGIATVAHAADTETQARLRELEQRVQSLEASKHELEAQRVELDTRRDALEARQSELEREQRALAEQQEALSDQQASAADDGGYGPLSQLPAWLERFHLSGNADLVYYHGEDNAIESEGRVAIDNARIFFDVDLGHDLEIADRPLVGDAGFYVEWDIARNRFLTNRFGSVYARFDRLLGLEPLNLRFGRMPIPYGEEYVRFHEERPDNPLITFSAPAPYNWDEGLMLYGALADRTLEWKAAVMDGDNYRAGNTNAEPQLVAKLTIRPAPWVRLSVSGVRTGRLGTRDKAAKSALEFGGTHAVPFGSGTDVPSFRNGVEVPDDPDLRLETMNAGEIDLILESNRWGRLWLAYGGIAIRSRGDSIYDRDLTYAIAEGVLPLGLLTETLDRIYVALRYSVIGTFDSDEGYLLEAMNDGGDLGFNTKSVSIVSLGLGLRLNQHVTLKTEYAWYDFDLVRGVPEDLREDARDRNVFGIAASMGF